jgi:hypothetical protein
MGHHQGRNAAPLDRVEGELAHVGAQCRVEPGERLIQKQCAGVGQDAAHQRRARPLPARQGGRIAVMEAGEVRAFQRLGDGSAPGGISPDRSRKAEGEVVAHGEVRKQDRVLKHHPDPTRLGRKAADIGTVQPHRSRHREAARKMPADRVEQGRFADARRPHDRRDLSRRDGELDRRE